jgi:hypothetical protein
MSFRKSKKLALFYDANCFTTIPLKDLKFIIKNSDNYITSSVKREIEIGKKNNPNKHEFDLVFSSKDKLKYKFSELTLSSCIKNQTANLEEMSIIFLKENPILCSAYYTWLSSATNPAIVTDIYRHAFNHILHEIKNYPQNLNELLNLESKYRVAETQAKEKIQKEVGRNPYIKPHWILKSRKKRIDEIITHKIKLSDSQTVTAALIYSSIRGRSTAVITCDRDIIDIWENLFRTIIEKYATNELLDEKIQNLNGEELNLYNRNGIDITLSIDEISSKSILILESFKEQKAYIPFSIILFRRDVNKIFTYTEKIPLWLRDFILEYKKNMDCFSIESNLEMKYKIKFTMDPDFITKMVKYHVFPRKAPFYNGFLINCEEHCKYSQKEQSNPDEISDFI